MNTELNEDEKRQAITWYAQNWDLITIAQHFYITVEDLKRNINNIKHD